MSVDDTGSVRDGLRKRLAANLKTARERAGLSQPAVAQLMQEGGFTYSQQAITRLENGTRKASGDELIELARIYGVSLDELARPEGLARAAWDLRAAIRRANEAADAISLHTRRRDAARHDIRRLIARAEKEGHAGDIATEISIARRALGDGDEEA